MWPHLFPLYTLQIFKIILANGIVSVFPCVSLLIVIPEIALRALRVFSFSFFFFFFCNFCFCRYVDSLLRLYCRANPNTQGNSLNSA